MKKNTQSKKIKLSPTSQLIVAVIIFTISVLASRYDEMVAWEIEVFNFIYKLPDFVLPFFFLVTQLGSIYFFAILLILFLAKKKFSVVVRLLMTGLMAYLASGFAKDIWGRIRPNEFLPDVINRDYIVWGPGFPSGHVALATALALVVNDLLPKQLRWLTWFFIISVGLSRMYLGIHAPLDIVGGFAIGLGSYALFRHVRIYDLVSSRYSKNGRKSVNDDKQKTSNNRGKLIK